jgi:UDP-N-acetylmuramoyl-L-alanyl-D-glutamate--2,6-diaminopimelate ligase
MSVARSAAAGRRLSSLAASVPTAVCRGDATVLDVTHNSRQVGPGWLFCAVRGAHYDGHAFAAQAVRAGASALLVEHWVDLDVPQLKVPLVRAAMGNVAAAVHGWPARQLRIGGVTGTNGKTTTAFLIERACATAGLRTGLVGTIETHVAGRRSSSVFTTPEAPDLQRCFAEMVRARTDVVAMEVSSHGLDQHRLDGTRFDVAVFTNLSPEHLDYHGTVEQYWETKARLFQPHLSERAVICTDDEWGVRLARQARIPVTTYGFGADNDVVVRVSEDGLYGSAVQLSSRHGEVMLHTSLPGLFNAKNVAAAYLAARALGVPADDARDGIAACTNVPGRFECVDGGQPFLVVVDYAHTPDALGGMIGTVRELRPHGKVWLVVGARGGRDRFKRPLTGRVAAQADVAIFTSDNPGFEDPASIAAQLLLGTIDLPSAHILIELDRRRAIATAVGSAGPDDVVLIVGRGAERVQHIAGNRVEMDDRDVVHEALANRGYSRRSSRSSWSRAFAGLTATPRQSARDATG